jgi:hypothetical protein
MVLNSPLYLFDTISDLYLDRLQIYNKIQIFHWVGLIVEVNYRHIENLSMKVKAKKKKKIYRKLSLQIFGECIILFSNDLVLPLNQFYLRLLIY